jgi:hypothetical protein
MPKDTREPQSYGSGADWVTGKTGQQVNEQKDTPAPEHRDFYDERRSSESTAPDQGGKTSDVQLAENAQPQGRPAGEHEPVTKVTAAEGGSKRGGFFKKRDYE